VGGTIQESTGLTTLGAREYDADTGRFISADPIIDYNDPQQINGYAYSNNNPVTFSDPTGLWCDSCNDGKGWPTVDGYGDDKPKKGNTGSGNGNSSGGGGDTYSPAQAKADEARAKEDAAKKRAIAIAKELGGIIADELGITDALDCFTTGALGSCGATALNVVSSLVSGGPVGRLFAKYGWRVDKAIAVGKRIVGLGKKLWDDFKDWRKSKKAAETAADAADECNSFTPDTKVLMADGTVKDIKDVDIGDKAIATDPETGETTTETVTAEIKGTGLKHLVKVTVDINGDKGTKTASVTATDGHPFWVPELGEWIGATDLKSDESLRTSAGTYVQITAVKRWTVASATVHNLTVSDLHTYYVLAGGTPVLVHNATPGQKCDLTLGAGPNAREGVALENGDIEADGVRDLINESGNAHGCHTCSATTLGTRDGDWIPDHQPPSSLVAPGSPQTAYPHCLPCARTQGGVVSQLPQGKSKKEW
jgi:RHS repeat-associated protein